MLNMHHLLPFPSSEIRIQRFLLILLVLPPHHRYHHHHRHLLSTNAFLVPTAQPFLSIQKSSTSPPPINQQHPFSNRVQSTQSTHQSPTSLQPLHLLHPSSSSKIRTSAIKQSSTNASKQDQEEDLITVEEDIEQVNKFVPSGEEVKEKTSKSSSFSKVLRLKDRMWVRETLEDLTAAEFACNFAPAGIGSTSSTSSSTNTNNNTPLTKKKAPAVDFENLIAKLEKRLDDMCVRSTYGKRDDACIVSYPMVETTAQVSSSPSQSSSQSISGSSSNAFPEPDEECWLLLSNYGMGSVTYTDDQRSALVLRLLASKQALVNAMGGSMSIEESNNDSSKTLSSSEDLDQIREKLQTNTDITEGSNNTNEMNNTASTSSNDAAALGPSVYVREDGTVDWDGALQDRAALKKFGISVWARINGQDPETIDEDSVEDNGGGGQHQHEAENKVTVKIPETDAISEKKMKLDSLRKELEDMEVKHTALLNSAVTAGSAVANVNLALVEPQLRSVIRASDNELQKKKDQVSFETLIYELERIYTYLDGELGNTAMKGNIPLQDRINVAEFGLLESQIGIMQNQIDSIGEIDSDVLAVVTEQTADFKRRLGIDYYVTGLTFDPEAIKIWLNDFLLEKLKKALAFYGKGFQLLFNDVVFSSSLIGKALTGYTLKPREVTTLRRTFKDVINFIPFAIIWLIPLSPVGHALVFTAIQRFFPDFFPSSFTESRQNLLALYESTEFSEFTIEENWQQKTVRLLEATGYFIVENAKKLGVKLFNQATDRDDVNGSAKNK